jgi:hypothetical protein
MTHGLPAGLRTIGTGERGVVLDGLCIAVCESRTGGTVVDAFVANAMGEMRGWTILFRRTLDLAMTLMPLCCATAIEGKRRGVPRGAAVRSCVYNWNVCGLPYWRVKIVINPGKQARACICPFSNSVDM